MLTSLAFSYFLFPVLIKILEWKQILDKPDNRKIHKNKTPSLGGIPIFIGVVFSLLVWMSDNQASENKYLFSSLSLFFVIGLRDDIIPMKPYFKLLGQFVPIVLIILLGHVRLESFYGLGSYMFDYPLSVLITIFVIIVITNSINLIDGIDGLAAVLSLVSLVSLGLWFYAIDQTDLAYISAAFIGAIAAFLFYNWNPSRIFMGDTGALLIGFLLSVLIIKFININFKLADNDNLRFSASITTAICFIIIPLTDTLRVFLIRISKLKSPFTADNNHIHHVLLRMGLKHSTITIILGLVNMFFIGISIVLNDYNDLVVFPIVIFLVLVSLGILHYFELKTKTEKTSIK